MVSGFDAALLLSRHEHQILRTQYLYIFILVSLILFRTFMKQGPGIPCKRTWVTPVIFGRIAIRLRHINITQFSRRNKSERWDASTVRQGFLQTFRSGVMHK